MKSYAYDFHLHSCLSPCGDNDMTPYNLVNMAKLLDLDIIALTDHNSTANCASAVRAGEEIGLPVIPGMELCTAEEIHIVCLFPDCARAEAFGERVHGTLPPVKNKPETFGDQLMMDHEDKVTGSEELLLVTASSLRVDQVADLCGEFGGYCYPAHIDRSSFSILSSLGAITADMGFRCAEVTPMGDLAALRRVHPALVGMRIMRSSDAHYLENMREAADRIHLEECSPQAVLDYFRQL